MWLIIILYAICASMFTISKSALSFSTPLFFMSFRMLGSGILLFGYLAYEFYRFRQKIAFSWADRLILVQVVLFHVYFAYVFDLWALKKITSIESAFIYNLSPFMAAFFSYLWFGEKMTLKKWLGLSLGFLSLVPVFVGEGFDFSLLFSNWIPKLVTLAAVSSSAYGWIVVRVLMQKGYSTIFVNAFSMFIGGFLALISSLSYEYNLWSPFPVSEWGNFLWYTFLIIIVANIAFYNLYGYLLKFYTATLLSFAGFMCPFFAAIFGWFFLNEPIGLKLLISLFLVCIGLYIFYHEELKQGYVKNLD